MGTRADTEEGSRLLELRYLFSSPCNYIPYPGPFTIFQVSFPPNLDLQRAEISSPQLSCAQHKTGTCLPSYRAGASASRLVLCPETCLPLVLHSEHNLCSDILSQSAPLRKNKQTNKQPKPKMAFFSVRETSPSQGASTPLLQFQGFSFLPKLHLINFT